MGNYIYAFIIIIFCAGCNHNNGPALTIDTKLLKQMSDTVTSSSFRIHNSGNKVLIIEDIISSCECTILQLQKGDSVLPGKSLKIPIQFERSGNKQKQLVTITLKTNTLPKLTTIKFIK